MSEVAFSTDIEQEVIGALVGFSAAFERIADKIDAGDFAIEAHRVMFDAISKLALNGKPIDYMTVLDRLTRDGNIERAGGAAYFAQVAGCAVSARSLEHHAKRLGDFRIQREMLTLSAELAELAQSAVMDSQERIDAAMAKVMQIGLRKSDSEPEDIGTVLPSVVEALSARVDRGGEISGVPTGLTDLDEATSGLQPGDLVIIAGRPSMGKTTLALNIAEHVSIEVMRPVLVFSLEMAKAQLAERSIASIGGVSSKAMRKGMLTEDDWSAVGMAMERMQRAPLIIDDSGSASVQQMLARARRIKRQRKDLALIVIDYLQLMKGDGSNRNEELGGITRGMKLLARDIGCPVVLLSQLSRQCEQRTDKRPVLSDLRESGAIEQDADLVIMCYRDDYYDPESPFKGCAELIIRKQRMGELGTVNAVFDGAHSRFLNADPGMIARIWDDQRERKDSGRSMRRRISE